MTTAGPARPRYQARQRRSAAAASIAPTIHLPRSTTRSRQRSWVMVSNTTLRILRSPADQSHTEGPSPSARSGVVKRGVTP